MRNMLDEIINQKRQEVERNKQALPLAYLEEKLNRRSPPLDFATALRSDTIQLIAEVKRASPSRGVLRPNFDPVELAEAYSAGGAAAISVLTEVHYFHGSLEHLLAIRDKVKLPLLRKDFIFDPYQVYESRAYGADALLLIVAILSQAQLKELLWLSHHLGLECLVEVHNELEVDRALASGAKIIGINNRNLHTFAVNINVTRRLCCLIPKERIVVSESGIRNIKDVEKLREWGVNAILVGEALVTADNVITKMRELTS